MIVHFVTERPVERSLSNNLNQRSQPTYTHPTAWVDETFCCFHKNVMLSIPYSRTWTLWVVLQRIVFGLAVFIT